MACLLGQALDYDLGDVPEEAGDFILSEQLWRPVISYGWSGGAIEVVHDVAYGSFATLAVIGRRGSYAPISGHHFASGSDRPKAMLCLSHKEENDMQAHEFSASVVCKCSPWNKGKSTGAKPPLRPKHVWSIRTKLQIADRKRDLAMFNLAIDSKLRGCDVVALKVEDIAPHGYAVERATVRQKKTGIPVRFEVTEHTRQAVDDYIRAAHRKPGDFLFAAPRRPGRGLSTRQYARLVGDWIRAIGLDPCMFGTHSLRRTKATLIYRRTGNLRAVQLLLGHSKIESTVRYLGIEVDDALAIAEQVDV
jgi:hypothetical protein